MTAGKRLALFVREPVPGAVKTRLEPALGAAGAAALYRAFLEDLAAALAAEGEWESFAVHDGPAPGAGLEALFRGGWSFLSQGAGTLGDRLSGGFRRLAGAGEGATVVAGSDVPSLSPDIVRAAFAALEAFRGIVFSPSPDGGFSLVGISWPVSPEFLEGRIGWSASTALEDAAREAEATGHEVRYLPELPDVDEPGDLDRLAEFLRENPSAAPATARALFSLTGAWGGGGPR